MFDSRGRAPKKNFLRDWLSAREPRPAESEGGWGREDGRETEQSKIRSWDSRGEPETLIDSDVSLRELRQGFGIYLEKCKEKGRKGHGSGESAMAIGRSLFLLYFLHGLSRCGWVRFTSPDWVRAPNLMPE